MDDIDYDLIFGISDHAVDVEVHAPDNHIPEFSKLTDESSSTPQEGETMNDSPLEREQLDSNTLNDEEHSFEGEQEQLNAEIEGEHVVEGEHNVDDAYSNAGSEYDEIFEYAPLEFDPAYRPMEKWTRDHPKDQNFVADFDDDLEGKKQAVLGTVEATQVITPIVEESQENVVIPSKTWMFQRIKMKSMHKRKSSSQKLLRKPQLSHQGVLFREKKKTKKARKIVSSSESTEEDERVPETLEVTSILTSSILETTVIITPKVSISKSIFEEVRTSGLGENVSKNANQGPFISTPFESLVSVTPTSNIPLTSTTIPPTFEHIINQPITSVFSSQSTDTPKPTSPTETDHEGFGGVMKLLKELKEISTKPVSSPLITPEFVSQKFL
ncbi:unnamed protein product [Lactuca saligna]|uniref:Uncharacterized protein n=1 Tax=Lactuca saligna TaxID=75948 RepID=A0AA36EF25_LACSI|nr:unnamed protein product [Lactuca saligna]